MDIIRYCVCLFIWHHITDSSAVYMQLVINGSDSFLGESARGGSTFSDSPIWVWHNFCVTVVLHLQLCGRVKSLQVYCSVYIFFSHSIARKWIWKFWVVLMAPSVIKYQVLFKKRETELKWSLRLKFGGLEAAWTIVAELESRLCSRYT